MWFSSYKGEDLNVIFCQNMHNMHNLYKSDERQISQKNPEYAMYVELLQKNVIITICMYIVDAVKIWVPF